MSSSTFKGVQVFKIIGIDIKINYTWFIIFGLVTWSLASGYYPNKIPGMNVSVYWLMGIFSSVLLFTSVLAHELSHSFVAKKHGLNIKSITLFIFGGVAQIEQEPKDAKTEFKIAIAGPACSFFLSFLFGYMKLVGMRIGMSLPLLVVFGYLSFINGMLGIFNLVPGFPLDGGRVLRSFWWHKTGDLRRATQIASNAGKVVATILIILGFINVFGGDLIGGIWLIFIGMFLQQASEAGYQQVLIRKALGGIKVEEVMTKHVITVDENTIISDLIEKYFFIYRFASFPVVSGRKLIGIISLHDIKELPRENWFTTRVGDVMEKITEDTVVHPHDDATSVLNKMVQIGKGRMPVVLAGHLIGIISRKDIMSILRIRADLG